MSSLVEIMENQNTIIQIQSDVIDGLFVLLMQYISTEEADKLPIVQKMNESVRLRQEIEQT